jgi:hypothetical protein
VLESGHHEQRIALRVAMDKSGQAFRRTRMGRVGEIGGHLGLTKRFESDLVAQLMDQ